MRPQTLSVSTAPVAVGAAIAGANVGPVHWLAALVAALAAALIQIGTNLHNDAADYHRGADGPARVGPPRVTVQGLISAAEVDGAALLCFVGAAAAGSYLVLVGGWPILCSASCRLGSVGPIRAGRGRIAYTPLGEVFVLVFFGLVAVGGTYWLVAGAFGLAPVWAGVAMGLFGAAVLLVNNHRDREEDARVGRWTLAIAIGEGATRWLYSALMLAPFVLIAPLSRLLPSSHLWLALMAAPLALVMVARFVKEPPGRGFNTILAQTAQTQMVFAMLLCIGAIL